MSRIIAKQSRQQWNDFKLQVVAYSDSLSEAEQESAVESDTVVTAMALQCRVLELKQRSAILNCQVM